MANLKYPDFKGPAKLIEDYDLPRIGDAIGVGEDEVHMLIDVEAGGAGFDAQMRPKILFEPHVFWRELGPGKARDAAEKQGLAYPKWKRSYPKDSYPRLVAAMKLDEAAALRSASWGATQILGDNFKAAGFASVQDMVNAMCEDEENHIAAMIAFVKSSGIDDELRALAALTRATTPADCAPIARVYNGPGYAENRYHIKMAEAHNRWRKIPDTPAAAGPIIAPPAPGEGPMRDTVKQAQQLMRDKGYVEVGKIDGIVGPSTTSAVTAFQIANSLPVTGKVTSDLLLQLNAAPMRPVSAERANATVMDLVREDVPAVKPASVLKKIGLGLGALTGLGSVVDGGVPDLDKLTSSINKTQVILGLLGDKLPWLIGLAAAGAVIFYGQKILTRQLEGFRKGTVR